MRRAGQGSPLAVRRRVRLGGGLVAQFPAPQRGCRLALWSRAAEWWVARAVPRAPWARWGTPRQGAGNCALSHDAPAGGGAGSGAAPCGFVAGCGWVAGWPRSSPRPFQGAARPARAGLAAPFLAPLWGLRPGRGAGNCATSHDAPAGGRAGSGAAPCASRCHTVCPGERLSKRLAQVFDQGADKCARRICAVQPPPKPSRGFLREVLTCPGAGPSFLAKKTFAHVCAELPVHAQWSPCAPQPACASVRTLAGTAVRPSGPPRKDHP
jgi:hypothetical protein